MSTPKILVTGASGQLGRLVVDALLTTVAASQIAVTVRHAGAATDLARRGIQVFEADYEQPAALDKAFAGIDRLLLISSNALGQRVAQHRNVVAAAKTAGVRLLAYTSVLHADTSKLGLADEHLQTETELRQSGVPFVLLRNGWYTENYAASIPSALAHNALLGSAGDRRIASAARADYAAAAATVLTSQADQAGRVYELAGDDAYTLTQFAAEISKQSGQTVSYHNLPEAEFKAVLVAAGLPEPLAALLSDSDMAASQGALFDDQRQLSKLIGRPTTPFAETIAQQLRA
jgi:NAD(P)H dehydrogenase (quinone)